MDKITLEEWKAGVLKKVEEFSKYWQECNKAGPSTFPDKMLAGDWDEQFDFYEVTGN